MNWLDVVLALILVASMVLSFRRGLSRTVIHLVSTVLALVLSLWFYGMAGSYLLPYVSSRSAANLAGFILVFAGVLLLGGLVSWVVGKFLKVTGLSLVDHALGAGFGMVRGILIAVALLMGIMAFYPSEKPPESVVHSRMAPYMVQAARVFAAMAPHELKEGFRKSYAQVRSAWGKALGQGPQGAPDAEKGHDEGHI
jgi:membrane protein required for colicin V production